MESSDPEGEVSLGGYKLLVLASKGDDIAYKEFALRYVRLIRGYLRASMTTHFIPQSNFEDLRQNVLLRILADAKRSDHSLLTANEARFLSWLRVVVKSAVMDWLRKNRRNRGTTTLGDFDEEIESQDDFFPRESILLDLIVHLPRLERKLVELTYLEGMKLAQAAIELKLSPSRVARLNTSALRHLRTLAQANAVAD